MRVTLISSLTGFVALALVPAMGTVALGQSQPAPTVPVSATPIPVTQQPTGSVDPSQHTGTLPGLPGVVEPRGVATQPTPPANAVPSPGMAPTGTPLAVNGGMITVTPVPRAARTQGPSGGPGSLIAMTPSDGAYNVAGLVVGYEPGKAISLKGSNGMVRTIALPANLNVPPDLTNGRYATVRLKRKGTGAPDVLAVTMGRPTR